MLTKNKFSKILFGSAMLVGCFITSEVAFSKPVVGTSTSTIANLVQSLTGNSVDVFAIARGSQDPHYVEAKPSYMVKVRKADVFFAVGLDLEIGWLPLVLRGARNPNLIPGQPGYIEVSQFIDPIEKVTGKIDRSKGDIHGKGNPHFLLNPMKARKVVVGISGVLQQKFPQLQSEITQNTEAYLKQLDAKIAQWQSKAQKPKAFVTHHRTLNDFLKAFNFTYVDSIEAKPGIPPTSKHILQLIRTLKAQNVDCLLIESFFETTAAKRLQKSAGTGIAVVPTEVKATKNSSNYIEMIDAIFNGIQSCKSNEVFRG